MTNIGGNTAVIQSVGLTKEFKDFWNRPKAKAVNDIDFEVYKGETLGLLGPNGSGKSTTVKMILGLLYPSAGQLKVLGKSPRDVNIKRSIGYLPEESYLYKYLTAMETLDFFGALFNLSASDRRSRSEQLLEMVGLTHAKNRPVGEFSKGMQRRIGLAQAMINDPDLLILDEPTSGLDPIGCKEVKDLIQLLKKRGKTVLVTSHLLSDVEDVCDRVIILYGGKVRATGALNDLLKVPDESRITTPLLKPEITEKVVSILREQLKGEEFLIDHPRKSLEDFFLEVISQAKEASLETAGVVSGGQIAGYLQVQDENGKQILSDLTKPELEQEVKPDEPSNIENLNKTAYDEENREKLEELTVSDEVKPKESSTPDDIADETEVDDKDDLSDVNQKLSDLL